MYRNSVPPMPDNRQVKSNAVANQSADNIEGSFDFLCTFGDRGSNSVFVFEMVV